MPRISFDGYDKAVAAVGVKRFEYDKLVPTKNRAAFQRASRAACKAFLAAHELNDCELKYRNQFLGYAAPDSQGVWCTWGDALTFAPEMALGSATASVELFILEMGARGWEDITLEAVQSARLPSDIALRWKAWQAALQFWADYKPPTP